MGRILATVTDSGSGGSAPVINGVPTISGSPVVGQTLVASAASVAASPPSTRSWSWLRDDTPISGADSASYTVVTADIGAALKVVQSETNGVNPDASAESTATADVTAAPSGGASGDVIVGALTPNSAGPIILEDDTVTPGSYESGMLTVTDNSGVKELSWTDLVAGTYDVDGVTVTVPAGRATIGNMADLLTVSTWAVPVHYDDMLQLSRSLPIPKLGDNPELDVAGTSGVRYNAANDSVLFSAGGGQVFSNFEITGKNITFESGCDVELTDFVFNLDQQVQQAASITIQSGATVRGLRRWQYMQPFEFGFPGQIIRVDGNLHACTDAMIPLGCGDLVKYGNGDGTRCDWTRVIFGPGGVSPGEMKFKGFWSASTVFEIGDFVRVETFTGSGQKNGPGFYQAKLAGTLPAPPTTSNSTNATWRYTEPHGDTMQRSTIRDRYYFDQCMLTNDFYGLGYRDQNQYHYALVNIIRHGHNSNGADTEGMDFDNCAIFTNDNGNPTINVFNTQGSPGPTEFGVYNFRDGVIQANNGGSASTALDYVNVIASARGTWTGMRDVAAGTVVTSW